MMGIGARTGTSGAFERFGSPGVFLWTVFLVLLLPSSAVADVPIPSLFGVGAPFFFSMLWTWWLFFAVLAIEAFVLWRVARLPWHKILLLDVVANLASSVLGFFLGAAPCCLPVLLLAPAFLYPYFVRKCGYKQRASLVLAVSPLVVAVLWIAASAPATLAGKPWVVFGSLVLGYLLSVFVEAIVFALLQRSEPRWRWAFLANAGSYVLLLAILIAHPANPLLPGYLLYNAGRVVRSGNTQKALKMVELVPVSWVAEAGPFSLANELEIAEIMAQKGDLDAARRVLDRVVETPRKPSAEDKDITERIEKLQKALAERQEPSR